MIKSDPFRQLLLAFVLLTRLPSPQLPQAAFTNGARAVWAYPFVGAIIGIAGLITGQIAIWIGVPPFGAAVAALAVMMLITGAMHEDGLADVFDGFWGGFTPERRLEIMRDSQIGTYGVLALIMVTLLRISAIASLLGVGGAAIIAAAALSRAVMPALMHALPYARTDGLSYSVGQPSARAATAALIIGGAIAVLCVGATSFVSIVMACAVALAVAVVAKRKIGGQTGDVLGATQQLSEAVVLLTCVALF